MGICTGIGNGKALLPKATCSLGTLLPGSTLFLSIWLFWEAWGFLAPDSSKSQIESESQRDLLAPWSTTEWTSNSMYISTAFCLLKRPFRLQLSGINSRREWIRWARSWTSRDKRESWLRLGIQSQMKSSRWRWRLGMLRLALVDSWCCLHSFAEALLKCFETQLFNCF